MILLTLEDPCLKFFRIDEITGELCLISPLDREENDKININIIGKLIWSNWKVVTGKCPYPRGDNIQPLKVLIFWERLETLELTVLFGELMSTVKNKCALEYLNYFQTELDFWVTLKYINIKVLLEPLFCPFSNFAFSRGSETQSGNN